MKMNIEQLQKENKDLKKENIRLQKQISGSETNKKHDNDIYLSIFELSPAGIIIEDKNGKILDANPSWCKMTGYSHKEIVGQNIRIIAHPDNYQNIKSNIKKLIEGKKIRQLLRSIKKDGSEIYVQVNERAIKLPNGEPGILSICQDMTKETQAKQALIESEEELKLSEERYKKLFEYSPDSIVLHSKGIVLSVNKSAKRFFEAKTEFQLVGKPIMDFIHPDYHELVIKRLSKPKNEKKPIKIIEEKFITLNGNIRDVEVSAVPLFNVDNKISMVVFRDITDRKLTEDALRESEEKFRSIFDNFSVGTGIVGMDGKFININQKFADIVGYSIEELQIMRNEDLTYPEDAEETKKQMKLLFERKIDSFNLEKRLIHKNGNMIWVDLTVKPKFDINGKIESVIGVTQNITERKTAEKALRESEERFRTMFSQNRAVMLLVDPTDNQRILDANKAAEDYYGYNRSQLLKLNMGDINVMSEGNRNVLMKKAIEKPQNYFQFKHKLSTGEVKDVEVYASPIMQQDKKCMFVIVHDITERKKAEREITKLAAVVEQAVDSIIITDIHGKINYVNAAFKKITGYKKSEALGQNPNILKSGRHDNSFYKDLWSTILSGNKWQGVIINKRKNGSLYYEKAVIFPVKNEIGEIINFTGIMRDITLERKLEQQLQQVQKMEAIGTLSGGIAHDFNNILTVINGHSEIALMNMDESNAVYEDLISILNAGKRAEKLTNQLLAFSRKQIHELKVIDINQTIKDLDKMLRRLIPENIKIVSEFPDNLPYIKADPGQIEQILINLVINARDAINENQNPENKKTIIVKTNMVDLDHVFVNTHPGSQTGPHILLSVQDTGAGMTLDVKNRIFEPFFTTKDVDKGTGLGLATVYGIVKQNDGSIYVESNKDNGTLFEIYWPVTTETPEKDYIESINQKDYTGKETILFVEDDEDVRSFASVALKNFGYKIIEARTGKNALQIIKSKINIFDLIVTDLIMPEMNGQDLAKKVYEIQPNSKILFVSGYTFEHLLKDGEIEEGINFLQKPYTIQSLLKRIRNILDG